MTRYFCSTESSNKRFKDLCTSVVAHNDTKGNAVEPLVVLFAQAFDFIFEEGDFVVNVYHFLKKRVFSVSIYLGILSSDFDV